MIHCYAISTYNNQNFMYNLCEFIIAYYFPFFYCIVFVFVVVVSEIFYFFHNKIVNAKECAGNRYVQIKMLEDA